MIFEVCDAGNAQDQGRKLDEILYEAHFWIWITAFWISASPTWQNLTFFRKKVPKFVFPKILHQKSFKLTSQLNLSRI